MDIFEILILNRYDSMLNSKSYLLKDGTEIPSNSDLNNYKTPGNYFVSSNSVANTLTNSPFTHAHTLKVEYGQGTGYPVQIGRRLNDGRIAYRLYNTVSSSWSDWLYFSDDATLFAGKAIQSGDDLNDYITPGIYYSQETAITTTLLNMPELFASGFSLDVKCLGSSNNLIQTITYASVSVGSAIYTRRRSSSLWGDWYKFTGTIISS